jgi:hypothetical protein
MAILILSQGVRISWLHWLKKCWSSHYRDWTTEEAVNVLFRPRTLISRQIFCEELSLDGDMQHFVGPANRFVCHSWKSSFSELVDGLLDTVHEHEAVLWIDLFSMQLHQQSGPPQSQVFYFDDVKNVLSRMSSFSLSLQPLFHPATFESRWSVFLLSLFGLFCELLLVICFPGVCSKLSFIWKVIHLPPSMLS